MSRQSSPARAAAALAVAFALSLPWAPTVRAAGIVDAFIERLRAACETRDALRGIWVRSGTLTKGALELAGTLDNPAAQTDALEAEADRILKEEPRWRAEIPGGVKAGRMVAFAVRSKILGQLQESLSQAAPDRDGHPGLLRQTRLDDLSFDREGRLIGSGICVNAQAHASRSNDGGTTPLGEIAQGLRDRLRNIAIPAGVDPDVFDRLQVDGIRLVDDPARVLQRAAARGTAIDDGLFLHGRFDASGRLVLTGYLPPRGSDPGPGREALLGLLRAPEFARIYGRPAAVPSLDAELALSTLQRYDWRPGLLNEIHEQCARSADPGAESSFRHCRIDQARFDYVEGGGLHLKYQGIALDAEESRRIAPKLRAWSSNWFKFDRVVDYDIDHDLKEPDEPLRDLIEALRKTVAERPALDGVLVEDVAFGPRGEVLIEGTWAGAEQRDPLIEAARPRLVKVLGESQVAAEMTTIPIAALLKEARGLVEKATALDECGLDRLYFKPREGDRPRLTLQATAMASSHDDLAAALSKWLETSELARRPEMRPAREFLPDRPASARAALWKLSYEDPTLDGVRVDRVFFDADNQLVIECQQEYPGQLDGGPARDALLRKWGQAAADAWPGLPVPVAKINAPRVASVRAILEVVREKLPFHKVADGVLLQRACWRDNKVLVFRGIRSREVVMDEIEKRVRGLAAGVASVALELTEFPVDRERCRNVQTALIDQLREGRIATAEPDTLNEIVFGEPEDSTSWYLRAAYNYLGKRDSRSAQRDMERVLQIESDDRTGRRAKARRSRISPVTGASRTYLDQLEDYVQRSRLRR